MSQLIKQLKKLDSKHILVTGHYILEHHYADVSSIKQTIYRFNFVADRKEVTKKLKFIKKHLSAIKNWEVRFCWSNNDYFYINDMSDVTENIEVTPVPDALVAHMADQPDSTTRASIFDSIIRHIHRSTGIEADI